MPLYANMHGICLSYKWSYYGLPNLRPVPFRTLRSRLHLRHVRHLLCSDLFLTVYPPVVGNLLGKISPALQPNSERFQQGSRTVPDFRGVHFRVTSTQPQRLKPNRFAVGNMGKWCKMTNLLPFTAKLRSVDHSVVPGRLRMGKQWFTNGWNGVTRLPDFSDRDMISEIRENHHRSNSDSYRECQKNGVWIPSGNVTSLHGKLMIQPLLKGIVMSHENTKFLMISCAIPIHVYVYIYIYVCVSYVCVYIYIYTYVMYTHSIHHIHNTHDMHNIHYIYIYIMYIIYMISIVQALYAYSQIEGSQCSNTLKKLSWSHLVFSPART